MVISGSPKISDWNDADQGLSRLAQLRRQLTLMATTRDTAIAKAKTDYVKQAEPLLEQLEEGEAALKSFVLANQHELDGRSRRMNYGRLGFLLVKQVSIRNVKRAIAWLIEAGKPKLQYLHVSHKLNKETLRDAPDDVLRAIGAKVKSRDEFWYEVDGSRYAVED